MRKHVFLISGTIAIAILIVSFLAWRTLDVVNLKNGFVRTFNQEEMSILFKTKKSIDIIDFAGENNNNLYFQTTIPSRLWVTDQYFKNGRYETIQAPSDQLASSAFYTFLSYPFVNILSPNVPSYTNVNLNGKTETMRFPSALFTRAVQISDRTFIYRGFDTTIKSQDQVFFKGNPYARTVQLEPNPVFPRIHDGGLSTDGFLSYDRTTQLVTYVLFYSNTFVVMDTSLNLKFIHRTIDTVSHKINNVSTIDSKSQGNLLTNITPTRDINGRSIAYKGNLYNVSKLLADNEDRNTFFKNTIVDVYEIESGKYKVSLYIPKFKRQAVSRFLIRNNVLYAIYKDYLVAYKLNFPT